jgi:serine/threonine-protein kinase
MTNDQEQHNDPAFEVLNQYLDRLHRGEYPDRARLLAEHPELAPALRCLDALESLAPLPAGGRDTPPTDLTATLPDTGSGQQGSSRQTSSSARPPRDFGDYELLEEIGRGGMGVVYKARQKSLDRIVAVKMINTLSASREQVERFQSEAKAAAGINHPHVVHIHEVGELYGQHYFAMEYVSGTTLAKRIDQERLGFKEAVELVHRVALAVHHLHQHGVVHRDLKPSNILLDASGQPKVTDFGLAKVSTPGTRDVAAGAIAGTPAYMSPEQAAGKGDAVGPLSDVYSLGAILYELLTRQKPFPGENPLDVLLQVREREPALPRQVNSRLPQELELIAMKCLKKSPQERYASAAALADDLDRYLKGETVEATPPNLVQRIWRWARREPALATRAGALSIFFAAVSGVYFLPDSLVDAEYYRNITLIVVLWLAASLIFQRMLTLRRWEMLARFLWGLCDTLLLLCVLLLGDGVASPMVIGFPLLIVAAGLWSHVPLVWFVTMACVLAYGTLLAKYYDFISPDSPGPIRPYDDHIDRPIYFFISLVLCGFLVAYQVSRTRALSRYFEKRPL